MTRKSPRELERTLSKAQEAVEAEPDDGVNIFTWPSEGTLLSEKCSVPGELSADLQKILAIERQYRNGAGGIEIFTLDDAADLYDRIERALADSELDVDLEAYVRYLGARARGELPDGEDGVREHFGSDVGRDPVDRVFQNALEAAA